eukprot:5786224-Amphidinium_carterae.1
MSVRLDSCVLQLHCSNCSSVTESRHLAETCPSRFTYSVALNSACTSRKDNLANYLKSASTPTTVSLPVPVLVFARTVSSVVSLSSRIGLDDLEN